MPSPCHALDAVTAVGYIGKPVHVELEWDDEPEPFRRSGYVIGIVLPVKGVQDQAYLMVMSPGEEFLVEVYLADIRSIRVADQIEGFSHA